MHDFNIYNYHLFTNFFISVLRGYYIISHAQPLFLLEHSMCMYHSYISCMFAVHIQSYLFDNNTQVAVNTFSSQDTTEGAEIKLTNLLLEPLRCGV